MILTHIAAGLIAAGVAGAITWNTQNWRWESKISGERKLFADEKRTWESAVQAGKDTANEIYRLNQKAKEKALEDRTKNMVADIAAADRARAAAERLRNTSERSLRAATENHANCIVSANTHAELFDQCRTRYRELGQAASGHVTDIKALIEQSK